MGYITSSQEDEILAHLQHKGPITPLEALRKFGVFRLAARVHGLRSNGIDIRTDYKRTRNGARVASYSLVRG